MLIVGVWTVVDKSEFEKLLGTDLYVSSAYILIATGVLVSLVAFLGCLGAVKEIRCMLLTVRGLGSGRRNCGGLGGIERWTFMCAMVSASGERC